MAILKHLPKVKDEYLKHLLEDKVCNLRCFDLTYVICLVSLSLFVDFEVYFLQHLDSLNMEGLIIVDCQTALL